MYLKLSIPHLKKSVGLGDVVAGATKSVGIKPCGGCKKRQEILNRAVVFAPKDSKDDNISTK
jgi:hypothetical protein